MRRSIVVEIYGFGVLDKLTRVVNDSDDQRTGRTSADFFAVCQFVLTNRDQREPRPS